MWWKDSEHRFDCALTRCLWSGFEIGGYMSAERGGRHGFASCSTAGGGRPESPGVLAHPAFSSLSNRRQSLQHPGSLFVQLALLFQCGPRRRSERELVAANVAPGGWKIKSQTRLSESGTEVNTMTATGSVTADRLLIWFPSVLSWSFVWAPCLKIATDWRL